MKTVAIISNDHNWTYNLRKEIIETLLRRGYSIDLILPYGEKVDLFKRMGCTYYDVPMFERRGKNPVKEIRLIFEYYRLLRKIKPDVVLTYTIKPNLYGGFVSSLLGIPYIPNITGLGSIAEKKNTNLLTFISKLLYKFGMKNAFCVFAQNLGNRLFLIENKIVTKDKIRLIPGSGVNLKKFVVTKYPDDHIIKFAFVSRILKEKGIEDYLEAATAIKKIYPNTEFHICGFCEEEYKGSLKESANVVIYHGMIDNIPKFLADIHCLVHPSYYFEGISNVCLEASASGRPVITTDHEGCRETVVNGKSGFIVPIKDPEALTQAIMKFINLSYDEKNKMGLAARRFVETNFDREIIVQSYLEEILKV